MRLAALEPVSARTVVGSAGLPRQRGRAVRQRGGRALEAVPLSLRLSGLGLHIKLVEVIHPPPRGRNNGMISHEAEVDHGPRLLSSHLRRQQRAPGQVPDGSNAVQLPGEHLRSAPQGMDTGMRALQLPQGLLSLSSTRGHKSPGTRLAHPNKRKHLLSL